MPSSRLAAPESGWPIDAALDAYSKAGANALPVHARVHVIAWLDAMAEWNARVDLTAARDAGELCDLMLADAAHIAPYFAEGARVVDVGTGAGAPGLALAILRPDLRVTLAEPLAKRTSFLRTVLAKIQREDVAVTSAREEALAKSAWDVAISRATFAPREWLSRGRLLAPHVWVFLAREVAPLHDAMKSTRVLEYAWPNTHVDRTTHLYEPSSHAQTP